MRRVCMHAGGQAGRPVVGMDGYPMGCRQEVGGGRAELVLGDAGSRVHIPPWAWMMLTVMSSKDLNHGLDSV